MMRTSFQILFLIAVLSSSACQTSRSCDGWFAYSDSTELERALWVDVVNYLRPLAEREGGRIDCDKAFVVGFVEAMHGDRASGFPTATRAFQADRFHPALGGQKLNEITHHGKLVPLDSYEVRWGKQLTAFSEHMFGDGGLTLTVNPTVSLASPGDTTELWGKYPIKWYWQPRCLGPITIQQVARLDGIYAYLPETVSYFEDNKPLKISMRTASATKEALREAFDLRWWRFGPWVGVSQNADSKAVLLLLPNTQFVHRNLLCCIKTVSEVGVEIEMRAITLTTPLFESNPK